MPHHLWMLLPWLVFAVAAGAKFWQLTSMWRRSMAESKMQDSERFRRQLERSWREDRSSAP
jgi:hypothetical protein